MMIRFLISLSLSLIVYNGFSQADIEKWTQDIDVYKTNLEKFHIDVYHKITEAEFDQKLQEIKLNLDKKTDLEVVLDLMRLTRKIGASQTDGHTAVSTRSMEIHFFPIEVFQINGHWRVIKTTSEYRNLLGKKLIKIDGSSIDDITKEVSQIAQYVENEYSKNYRTGQYLRISELLYGLKLTHNKLKVEFTLLDDYNKNSTVVLSAIPRNDFYQKTEFEAIDLITAEIEKPEDFKHDFLWFSPVKNSKAIYIKFESYPSFEEMIEFGELVLNYINENQSKQIIIDLRNNGGGDFYIGTILANYLNLADSIDWKSGVYVLTNRVTFSAGTSSAVQFRQLLNAKIIGEPTGSNPTGYQDMGEFVLPNSKLIITYSKRLFKFQQKETQGVQPEVLIEYEWESYSKGIDKMMQWIINNLKEKS